MHESSSCVAFENRSKKCRGRHVTSISVHSSLGSHGVSDHTLNVHTKMQARAHAFTHAYMNKEKQKTIITTTAFFIHDLYTRTVRLSVLVYTEARVIL